MNIVHSVVITGGCGFIGSNLLRHCLRQGWHVVAIDDMSNGHREFLPTGESFELVIDDFSSDYTLKLIESRQPDIVFALAANPRVPYSVDHPAETHENNVLRTIKLLESCRHNVGRVIFSSSCSVYGNATELPTPESARLRPMSPYALQKFEVESYLRMFYDLYGLDSVSLRFFNVYGPHALGDSPYTTALAAWLKAIRDGRPMRSDGNGSQRRDLIHVDDVCSAMVAAALREKKFNGDQINIGTGKSVSNMQILTKLREMFPGSTYVSAPWRLGDVMSTEADITKACSELGWEPKVDFWDGMRTTAEWAMGSDLFVNLRSRV